KPLLNLRSLSLTSSGESSGKRRTTIGTGPLQIQTTEHLLAALSGLGIDNALIEIDGGEIPGLDGSAMGFVEAIKKAKITEQDAPKRILVIEEPVWCKFEDRFVAVLPDENFRISYTMSYKSDAIGTQYYDITVREENFEREIAPARTFCLKSEALMLMASGLGKGAGCNNTLVMGKTGPFKNKLRFKDEPVRHKVLDLIGDLYLLGMPIKGHVIAAKSGHSLNIELVKKLKTLI
ncbi:MAG: UDP-3-O-acyl-N-acetylglucosamine deacetylase, partial [Candidatus Omnitrophica bacterium]|nr:UDP-3-O-acyl-N-acetylglucosamine deacetylase [Candidatus Omnitrophota bacterium]